MQRKIPTRSILFLSLIQIGLLLLLILFVMNRFFEGRSAGSGAVPRRSSNGPKSGCMRRFCVPSVPWARLSTRSESWGGTPPGRGAAAVYPGGWSAAGAVLDRGDLGWLALGRTASGSGGDCRCGRTALPCRPAHVVCPLRSGTVCPADGGPAPALCGGVAGAHPVLLINPIQNKKSRGRAAFGFLCWYAGNQSGCLPMEARISRLMASSPGSNSCPDSAMSQR